MQLCFAIKCISALAAEAATAHEQKYSLRVPEPKAQRAQGPGKREQQLLLHHGAAVTKNLKIM